VLNLDRPRPRQIRADISREQEVHMAQNRIPRGEHGEIVLKHPAAAETSVR
jgi:hypothetical protein